jgi:hypothetical protein
MEGDGPGEAVGSEPESREVEAKITGEVSRSRVNAPDAACALRAAAAAQRSLLVIELLSIALPPRCEDTSSASIEGIEDGPALVDSVGVFVRPATCDEEPQIICWTGEEEPPELTM